MAKNAFLPLPWQKPQWQTFNERIKDQRLPHAIMLNAVEGVGAERLAMAMAFRLLCNQPQEGFGCGQCKGCITLSAGSHPDFYSLAPEDDKKIISVAQVRALCTSLSKTAQQGGWKVVVIQPCESMNVAASNALLKSLEEPESNTLLILVARRLSLVPVTIRSRCQIESLPIPPTQLAKDWLSKYSGESQFNISQVLDVANGCPLLALDYMQGSGLESRQRVEALLDAVRRFEETPLAAAQACQKFTPEELISWILSYVHRLMVGELQNNQNQALFHFLDKLITARSWLLSSSTINTQLLWEELFIEWSQVFQVRRKSI